MIPALPELIERATVFADQIKEDLDQRWYETSEIELSITWLATTDIKAMASIEPSVDRVERHVVSLSYGLIDELYEGAFEFARYSSAPLGKEKTESGIYLRPTQFGILEAADLMFMAGVMFVIYHEIGHLNQNHGAIRAAYGADSSSSIVDDIEIAGAGAISGEQAAIFHATEFAADIEALDWMATQLECFKGGDYLDHAYLQCATVTFVMLIFNGDQPWRLDAEPIGSHPYPGPRWDFWVQWYVERTATLSGHLEIVEDRGVITKRLHDAAFMAILSWLTRGDVLENPEYANFCKGTSTHPHYADYMRNVINAWSRCEDQARGARRYGGSLSVLYFSDEFRKMIGADLNRDCYRAHLEKSLHAMR